MRWMLTVVVHHLLHVLQNLGIPAVGLGRHAADVVLAPVKHARRLRVNDEGDR